MKSSIPLLPPFSFWQQLSFTVYEINDDFCRKSQFFSPSRVFNAPLTEFPLEFFNRSRHKKARVMSLADVQRVWRYVHSFRYNMKKCSERRKHRAPKIFAPPQTPFPGAQDRPNLIRRRWSLPAPIYPVWWRSMHAISSYRGNRHRPGPSATNTARHKPTDRTDYNTLRR